MSTHYTPSHSPARKDELRAVLRKYGLEPDLETLWTTSLRDTDDIPWMSAEDMSDPRLTGTFDQYVAMQAGEFAVEEPEVENWYRYGE
jgi:hypothetical protein